MGNELPRKRPLTNIPPGKLSSDPRGRSRYSSRMRIAIYVFLLLIMLLGGAFAYGYSSFENNIQIPLGKFFHSVSRSSAEPAPNDSVITGRPWKILLLGTVEDTIQAYPPFLTQLILTDHICTD